MHPCLFSSSSAPSLLLQASVWTKTHLTILSSCSSWLFVWQSKDSHPPISHHLLCKTSLSTVRAWWLAKALASPWGCGWGTFHRPFHLFATHLVLFPLPPPHRLQSVLPNDVLCVPRAMPPLAPVRLNPASLEGTTSCHVVRVECSRHAWSQDNNCLEQSEPHDHGLTSCALTSSSQLICHSHLDATFLTCQLHCWVLLAIHFQRAALHAEQWPLCCRSHLQSLHALPHSRAILLLLTVKITSSRTAGCDKLAPTVLDPPAKEPTFHQQLAATWPSWMADLVAFACLLVRFTFTFVLTFLIVPFAFVLTFLSPLLLPFPLSVLFHLSNHLPDLSPLPPCS